MSTTSTLDTLPLLQGPGSVWSITRTRLLLSLLIGGAVILLVYQGPPVDQIGGVDLWFGLRGPISGDPWKWIGVALLLAVVVGVERLGLASLLIRRPTWPDIEWALYVFGGSMAWSWVADRIAPQTGNSGIEIVVSLGAVGIILLSVTAAVTEEIVYRGYIAQRLGALFGSGRWTPWAGAALSVALFTASHLSFFGPTWLVRQLPRDDRAHGARARPPQPRRRHAGPSPHEPADPGLPGLARPAVAQDRRPGEGPRG